MITFSAREILISCAVAGAYGTFFAVLLYFIFAVMRETKYILRVPKLAVVYYGSPFDLPSRDKSIKNVEALGSNIRVAVCITAFTVGYILCSYYSLDGSLRLYTAVLSVATFFLSRKYLKNAIDFLVEKVVFSLIYIPLLILRILLYPIHRIWLKYRENA